MTNQQPQRIVKFSELGIQAKSEIKVRAKDMLGKRVIIHRWHVETGQYGNYPVMLCTLPNQDIEFSLAGSGDRMLEQLESIPAEAYPIEVKIEAIGATPYFV